MIGSYIELKTFYFGQREPYIGPEKALSPQKNKIFQVFLTPHIYSLVRPVVNYYVCGAGPFGPVKDCLSGPFGFLAKKKENFFKPKIEKVA